MIYENRGAIYRVLLQLNLCLFMIIQRKNRITDYLFLELPANFQEPLPEGKLMHVLNTGVWLHPPEAGSAHP